MQNQVIQTQGQEFTIDDTNRMGASAAFADDVALSALALLPDPSADDGLHPVRAIIPYSMKGQDTSVGTVQGATGGVAVNSFWAIIGPRHNAQPSGIRSASWAGGPSGQYNTITPLLLGAQSAGVGTFRLDLVYCTLYVEIDGTHENRWTKDSVSGALSNGSQLTYKVSNVVVQVVAGVASSTPVAPSIPSDPPSGFNIPLALVRLPNGFNSLSTITPSQIMDISPAISLSSRYRPGNAFNKSGSSYFDGTQKSKTFISAGSVGDAGIFGMIDTSTASLNGVTLDDSTDWRKRNFIIVSQLGAAGENSAWFNPTSSALPSLTGATPVTTMSNSFNSGSDPVIWTVTNGGGTLSVKVNNSTGVMYTSVTGAPNISVYLNITSTSQIKNT